MREVGGPNEDREGESEVGSMASGFSRNSAWSDRSGYSVGSTGSGYVFYCISAKSHLWFSIYPRMSVSSSASTNSVVTWQSLTSKGMLSKRADRREKKKRKEKKRVTGKEGSRYEEDFLVDEMREVIKKGSEQIHPTQIPLLLRYLVRFGMNEKGKEIQEEFTKFLELVDSGLPALNESIEALAKEKREKKEREKEKQNRKVEKETSITLVEPISKENLVWKLLLWP